jgi:hypothetical protein
MNTMALEKTVMVFPTIEKCQLFDRASGVALGGHSTG